MIETGQGIDWAMAEHLAFGSLLTEGFPRPPVGSGLRARHLLAAPCRAHRPGERAPLHAAEARLSPNQARFEVINSMLSEEAVLGFEYGYSLAEPNALTLWEAQFGDFANGAQVVFDQFISSGERKWLRMSGLVCLLPHGYEGQGPEHSSARLERYPAAVRRGQLAGRQLHDARQLLPHPAPAAAPQVPQAADPDDAEVAAAPQARRLDDSTRLGPDTTFHRVLWDDAETGRTSRSSCVADDEDQARRALLGQGLLRPLDARGSAGIDDVYLLRVEQLYPFPARALIHELGRFPNAEIVWCQEEPKNMGAWSFIEPNIEWVLERIEAKHARPRYAGRPASASTATGLAVEAHSSRRAGRAALPCGNERARTDNAATVKRDSDGDRNSRAGAGRKRHRGDRRQVVQEGRRRSRPTSRSSSSRPTR